MDFGDIGLESTEAATAEAIMRARAASVPALKITGTCHNPRCGDDVKGRAFCNKQCSDEYEYLMKRRQ